MSDYHNANQHTSHPCGRCDDCAQSLEELARLRQQVEALTAQVRLLRKIIIHLTRN